MILGPFSIGKVKLRPNKIADYVKFMPRTAGKSEVSEQVRKAFHTGPGCSVGRYQAGEWEAGCECMKVCNASVPCMASPPRGYSAATFLGFLRLLRHLVCVACVFLPKLNFHSVNASFVFFPFTFCLLLKGVHPYSILIMLYVFNKLSYLFIILNSLQLQHQLWHCNIRSVIAKHPSYLKWYVIKFLAVHNSSLTQVLLS